MDATIEFDQTGGSAFQIIAETSDNDGSALRHLTFGVPGTNDEVELVWPETADVSGDDPVPVRLRVGTLSAHPAVLKRSEIVATEPPHEPAFGPNADGILRAVAEALGGIAQADPDMFAGLRVRLATLLAGKAPKILFGKVPEDGNVPEDGPGEAASGQATGVTMRLYGKVPKFEAVFGKAGKGATDGPDDGGLAGTVAQYAAAGVALGTLAAGPSGGAQGGVLGALVGLTIYLAG